jgi:NADPH:quinone reductase-like Zn-dependent oxidoreductase
VKLRRIFKWSGRVILLLLFIGLIVFFIAYWRSTNDCETSTANPTHPMKAIRYCEYGPPDVFKVHETEKPIPANNEILVRVRAAAANPLDCIHTGSARIVTGLRKPKNTRAGVDFSGTVEAVGVDVTKFKPGDDVFGGARGAFAEYVCVREERGVALKPSNMTFEQAAAVPIAAVTALQGLRDQGKIQSGEKVLINGASGGVGTFAVQIAKSYGAEVTGVCSSRNVDLVRSIGADHVIDYSKDDFTRSDQHYDLIYDLVCNHSFFERRRILNPNGSCVMAGLGGAGWHDGFGRRLLGELNAYLLSRFVSQKFGTYLAQLNQGDLKVLADLMQSGKITPVIDQTFSLDEVPAAMRYLEEGHAHGKVVIQIQ